ncbi:MAG: hypothetical protein ABIR37_04485 [Candidatus Saccharimonadales bacterium]
MNIVRSAFGYYETTGNPQDADVVIGHSFGTLTDQTSANYALAEFIAEHAQGRPIVADKMLADAFTPDMPKVNRMVEGEISNTFGKGTGTWGTLLRARAYMEGKGLHHPLMVAQAFHIGRVVMQAQTEKIGMDPIVPANLPRNFDSESKQIWTRSLTLWIPREVFGSFVLRDQGRL